MSVLWGLLTRIIPPFPKQSTSSALPKEKQQNCVLAFSFPFCTFKRRNSGLLHLKFWVLRYSKKSFIQRSIDIDLNIIFNVMFLIINEITCNLMTMFSSKVVLGMLVLGEAEKANHWSNLWLHWILENNVAYFLAFVFIVKLQHRKKNIGGLIACATLCALSLPVLRRNKI